MKKRCLLILTITLLFQLSIYSQVLTQPQKKLALVIGNGNYVSSSILANPENDARAMKAALQSVGFTVMEYENLNQIQMKKAIDDFGLKLKSNDVGLFFYAGHGIQSKGYNYLIPIDAQLQSEQQVEYDCVQADRVLALMEASGSKVNIIILDACRNNPFERSWTRSATGRGLAFMNAPSGTLIAYATSPGTTASDGSGNNGLYTSAILESMKIPNITILEMFQNVRSIVSQSSFKKQIPWESTSLTGNFYFNTGQIAKPESKELVIDLSKEVKYDYFVDSRDNEKYKIVKIGNQVWMAENLRTIMYQNRDLIQTTSLADLDISSESTPKYQWAYDGNENNVNIYGRLYTLYAIKDNKGVCPDGWHLPNNAEWGELIYSLGGSEIAGGLLKEAGTTHWKIPNTGATNNTGFTALPGGFRYPNGKFVDNKFGCYFWSTAEASSTNSYYVSLGFDHGRVGRVDFSKKTGLSVRCIKDK